MLVLMPMARRCWYLYLGHMGARTYVGGAWVLVLTLGVCGYWLLCWGHASAGTYVQDRWVLVHTPVGVSAGTYIGHMGAGAYVWGAWVWYLRPGHVGAGRLAASR